MAGGNRAVLTTEQNDQLTRTGSGTAMGSLLRRYWVPALLAREVAEPDGPPVRVQLMGERLIAFRDTSGRVGLIGEFCAHRGVSLFFGRNEECGLRCAYHGWKYAVDGRCLDVPQEPSSGFKDDIRLTAYPCLEQGGVIWTYMGPPEQRPEPPALEWSVLPGDRVFLSKRLQDCNFMQAMEGGIDSSHVSWLHSFSLNADPLFVGSRGNAYNLHDPNPVFEVVDAPGGLYVAARRNAEADSYYWRVTLWIMPWYTIIPPRGDHPFGAHAWVPIDDTSCWAWSINYHPHRALTDKETGAMQDGAGIHVKYMPDSFVPLANRTNDYLIDRAAQKTNRSYSGVEGIAMQDASLQESMGPIQDRTREHLVSTDNAIIMARRRLLRAAQQLAAGKAPPGLEPAAQRVRSVALVLPRDQKFQDAARDVMQAGPEIPVQSV
jgi:phenylpropionate dioxygenase-like ring-hydroxylating dioxygenase large terminal subunit